jgi:hypothetical protein
MILIGSTKLLISVMARHVFNVQMTLMVKICQIMLFKAFTIAEFSFNQLHNNQIGFRQPEKELLSIKFTL